MSIWLYSLVSVSLVSLISLVGVFTLSLGQERIKKISLFLVSFAVGGLFGDALIHLLPESFKTLGFGLATSLLVMLGILIFFVLERFLRWQHCHELDCPEHGKPVAIINLVGDAAHNIIDGMVIAASFAVSFPLGAGTTIAVIAHEIPHEIGNFGILIHSGFTAKKALFFNFLTALFAVLGTLIALFVGERVDSFSLYMLPVTAGGFLYVAGSDLLPELHNELKISSSIIQLLSILAGISVMVLLLFFE